jgi:hypothetical protein
MYGDASNFFNSGQSPWIDYGMGLSGQGIGGMGDLNAAMNLPFLGQLLGGTAGSNPLYGQMMSGQGTVMDTLTGLQNPQGNPYMQQMGQYGLDQMNKNFENAILPAINTNAVFSGGLGGSRQGIAQGQAADALLNEQANFLNNFYGSQYQNDMNRALGAASTMGGLQLGAGQGQGQIDQNILNTLGLGGQMLQNQMAPAQGAFNAYNQSWSPYLNYANILGQPTVLGFGDSSSMNMSGGIGAT